MIIGGHFALRELKKPKTTLNMEHLYATSLPCHLFIFINRNNIISISSLDSCITRGGQLRHQPQAPILRECKNGCKPTAGPPATTITTQMSLLLRAQKLLLTPLHFNTFTDSRASLLFKYRTDKNLNQETTDDCMCWLNLYGRRQLVRTLPKNMEIITTVFFIAVFRIIFNLTECQAMRGESCSKLAVA